MLIDQTGFESNQTMNTNSFEMSIDVVRKKINSIINWINSIVNIINNVFEGGFSQAIELKLQLKFSLN